MSRSWEIEGFLKEANGRLNVDGVSVVELAKPVWLAAFIFSEKRIRHNIARISRASEGMTCPLKICYAAKANSIVGVLGVVKNGRLRHRGQFGAASCGRR
jgi:diaminopimelate decarboxylase